MTPRLIASASVRTTRKSAMTATSAGRWALATSRRVRLRVEASADGAIPAPHNRGRGLTADIQSSRPPRYGSPVFTGHMGHMPARISILIYLRNMKPPYRPNTGKHWALSASPPAAPRARGARWQRAGWQRCYITVTSCAFVRASPAAALQGQRRRVPPPWGLQVGWA